MLDVSIQAIKTRRVCSYKREKSDMYVNIITNIPIDMFVHGVCSVYKENVPLWKIQKVKKNQCCNEKENYYNVFTHLT